MPSVQKIEEIVRYLLFKEDELVDEGRPKKEDIILVEGVIHKFGFHRGRVEEKRTEIEEQIADLPENFSEGLSFLVLCMDKHDAQWGEQRNVEVLMCLGMAIDKIQCLMPRELWPMLPGGVPYFGLKT